MNTLLERLGCPRSEIMVAMAQMGHEDCLDLEERFQLEYM